MGANEFLGEDKIHLRHYLGNESTSAAAEAMKNLLGGF